MTSVTPISDLIAACRRGDQAASKELVRRFEPAVRNAVRSRLNAPLRARFDSHDFTQNVWKAFFLKAILKAKLDDEHSLVAYLCQMGRWKVIQEHRRQSTQKGGLGRDLVLDPNREPAADNPTPSALLISRDRLNAILRGLSDREKRLFQMLVDGQSHESIAAEFGISPRSIRRLVARLHLQIGQERTLS